MDGNALVLCQCYLGTGRLAVLERWPHYRGGRQCLVLCQCCLGTGRLAVLERWPHYRGTGVSAILIGIREVGCFIEVATTYIQRPS